MTIWVSTKYQNLFHSWHTDLQWKSRTWTQERQPMHENVAYVPLCVWLEGKWEYTKLPPGRLSSPLESHTYWNSEENSRDTTKIGKNMTNMLITLWVSWRHDLDITRAKERQNGYYFFKSQNRDNYAFVWKTRLRKNISHSSAKHCGVGDVDRMARELNILRGMRR